MGDLSDILQVDGTVIAGVLILLTIKSVMSGKESLRKDAGFLPIPFAMSAIVALAEEDGATVKTSNGLDILFTFSIVFTIAGFVWLVWFLKAMTRKRNIDTFTE